MKPHRIPILRTSCLLVSAVLCTASAATAQTTGWNQTAGGTYDFLDTGNWVGGTINGIWDSSLTLAGSQTTTFGADTLLTGGLEFLYDGSANVTLVGSGGARTVTLGGDVNVNTIQNRIITIGSTSASSALNLNLAGDRTFSVAGGKLLYLYNSISGGDLVLTGGSTTSGGTIRMSRDDASAASSDITVRDHLTLTFDSGVNGNVGATRAKSVTLQSGGELFVWGNNSANSTNTITGALTADGARFNDRVGSGAFNTLTIRNGTAHTLLQTSELARKDHGTLWIRATNLGSNSIASKTAGDTSIEITGTAPTLVGGGASTGTGISIIPWAVGSTTYGSSSASTFLTYTAANGIRPLDTATEFAASIGGSSTDNVRLTAATALNSNETVNSLILGASGASLTGTGTLTVTSGAILMTRTTGASSNIDANLDFGTAEGIIGYVRGDIINGAIAGSGGLTIHGGRSDEYMQLKNGSSTYTGDTHILTNAMVVDGFLPHGARTGDVYVQGNLQLNVAGYHGTINGLFGNGTIKYENSSTASITIGDNDATSSFSGSFIANSNLSVIKTGTGTLTLEGDNDYGGTTTVSAGTLVINGTLANTTTTVDSGATLGGTGTLTDAVTINGVLAPGNSIGTISFGSSLDLLGLSNFEIDPLGLNADLADITGTVTYGGILNVLYGGSAFDFAGGMIFNLFDAGTFAGSFDTINLPDLTGTGLSW
ncbi:MAG: autotransporter-associated beta strand repeat-containing protein, partial [Verrucomicrobiae bacterium]|nr:autotransporter-associated beta strand repeat-containing protein [Verrucomicrobiae bacterium]